ncbi:MAG: hypothetical protein IJ538_05005 [Clostridia bacterium]|nr:hypothetical protein [Clostridia bacterium]
MNNFFYDGSDYALFKKALKNTDDEPIVINVLSSDPSLNENASSRSTIKTSQKRNTNMSEKFNPSPFGKFFGPRVVQRQNFDMKDFSSWKNKNYRQTEKNIENSDVKEQKTFSISDFLNSKTRNKIYNDSDELTSTTQKPINQLSSDDPVYQKFSLDSYMHKLEEQTDVKNKFETNDDLLEPIEKFDESIIADSSQDESFDDASEVNAEDIALNSEINGEQFRFETEELDKIKERLRKIELETQHIKEKTNSKVLSTEVADMTEDEDTEDVFDLEKLGIDDEFEESEKHEKTKDEQADDGNSDENANVGTETKVEDVKETEEHDKEGSTVEPDVQTDKKQEPVDNVEVTSNETKADVVDQKVNTSHKVERQDILTKEDFRTMTDEFMDKFAQMYKTNKKSEVVEENNEDEQKLNNPTLADQAELQAKIIQLMEQNQQVDYAREQRIQQAELENQRMAQEYENRIRQIEENYRRNVEEMQKQAYLEQLKKENQLQQAESNFKKREEKIKEIEVEKYKKNNKGAELRKEFKSNVSMSNLEMDKKLLEQTVSGFEDDSNGTKRKTTKRVASTKRSSTKKRTKAHSKKNTAVVQSATEAKAVTVKPKKTKTTTRKQTKVAEPEPVQIKEPVHRKRKRKIDTDIIGSYDFD